MSIMPENKKNEIINFILDHEKEYNSSPIGVAFHADYIDYGEPGEPPQISDYLIRYLDRCFEKPNTHNTYFNQLYSWFDLYSKDEDPYDQLLDTYESIHGPLKGKNIVEVGGGPVPALARKMTERMKDENGNIVGSITVYDPNLIERYPKVRCIQEELKETDTLTSNTSLIGMLPCEGTQVILTFVDTKKLESMVQLCRCPSCVDLIKREESKSKFKWRLLPKPYNSII